MKQNTSNIPFKIGDRAKIPKFASDESKGFYYGTIHHLAPSDTLIVKWDESIPFLGKTSTTFCARHV